MVGLAGGQEEQPAPLAGVQLQVEPHRARGVRQRHLHVAVPEERGWGEKGEGQAEEDTPPASPVSVGGVNLEPPKPIHQFFPVCPVAGCWSPAAWEDPQGVCFLIFLGEGVSRGRVVKQRWCFSLPMQHLAEPSPLLLGQGRCSIACHRAEFLSVRR